MGKMIDKLLLFIYSLAVAAGAVTIILYGFEWIGAEFDLFDPDVLESSLPIKIGVLSVGFVMLLISLRFLYISVRSGSGRAPSIDQRTSFGDIRISFETVENLALKTASRMKGVKDLKARVHIAETGLEIVLRMIVDGEHSIPELTEEVQRSVKSHIEEITGIPVASVSVYIANIIQSGTSFRSRVE